MNGARRYIQLSERTAVAAGGTYSIPLKLNKGLKGRPGREHLHVTKLFLDFTTVTTANFGADSVIDSVFLSGIVSNISLYASQDSPFGKRRGGQLIKDMSLYLALTALANMTWAPMFNFGREAIYQLPNVLSATDVTPSRPTPATSIPRTKRLHGKLHHQGPWGSVANGAAYSRQVTVTLPIGERRGEVDGMNPIPLGWLNGSGSECGCSKAEGLVNITLPSTVSGLAVTYDYVTVWAEVIELPSVFVPIQPWVTTVQTTDTVIQLDAGISGFRALCEDLTAGNAAQLTDVSGVSMYKLTIGGAEMYPAQYAAARAAWVGGNELNGPDTTDGADADPDADDAYLGTLGKTRYNTPYFVITNHGGPTKSAPDFGVGGCEKVVFELVGASNATNRRVLQGIWTPNDDNYLGSAEDYAGVSKGKGILVPNTPAGLSKSAIARGIPVGIPMKVDMPG